MRVTERASSAEKEQRASTAEKEVDEIAATEESKGREFSLRKLEV